MENSENQLEEQTQHSLQEEKTSDIEKTTEESSTDEKSTEEELTQTEENPTGEGDVKSDVTEEKSTEENAVQDEENSTEQGDENSTEEFTNREHPLLGRKVFFLNPPLSVASFVMENLREEQYEVYSISDYKSAKSILTLYEDVICFIFIDDLMPLRGWYNFIKSFEEDDLLKKVFLGAISGRIKPKDKENFLMNLRLPGGFVTLGGAVSDVLENIRGILKINGAKGCRHYVRLECKPNMGISGYLADQLRLYQFAVKNISTAGVAIIMDKTKGYQFQKNTVQDNICINLNRKTLVCSAVVYDVKSLEKADLVILLFTKHTTTTERTSIRQYIFQVLQDEFDQLQSNVMLDETNYAMEGVYGPAKESNGSEVIEDNVILNEVDDLKDDADETENSDDKKDEVSDEGDTKSEEVEDVEESQSENEQNTTEESASDENENAESENNETVESKADENSSDDEVDKYENKAFFNEQ